MLHNKIKNAAELRGLEPDEILRELHQDAERQLAREYDERQASKYGLKSNNDEGETFPQEIRLIARALAYRNATLDDFSQLEILLNKAYKAEIDGPEAFRGDSVPMESERISFYLTDNSYQWLIIEAPTGQTTEPEGTILGACCYSTDGHYKLKGQNLMKLGSIRFFAVLPRYHGLCIGQRLLAKVHDVFRKGGCQLSLVNLPSSRISLIDWIQRRGYEPVHEVLYPFSALGHQEISRDSNDATKASDKTTEPITLVQCLFALVDDPTPISNAAAETTESTTSSTSLPAPPSQNSSSSLSPSVTAPSSKEKAIDDDDDSAQPKTSYLFRPNPARPSQQTTDSSNRSEQQQARANRIAEKVKRLALDDGVSVHVDSNTVSQREDVDSLVQEELNCVD
jgi:GNAT superfamily N-acetyltransferase